MNMFYEIVRVINVYNNNNNNNIISCWVPIYMMYNIHANDDIGLCSLYII